LGSNCYTYAASKKDIGTGFGSLAQKKTKIKTKEATVGAVGISAEGPVGHLFYVEKVLESDLIISEGNYRHSFVTWRIIPKSLALGFL
jgi:surface antigen